MGIEPQKSFAPPKQGPESERCPDSCRPDLRRAYAGAALLSFQPLLLNALSVPVLAVIIRTLGPEGYGQWTIATTVVAAMTILASLGLRGTFIRRLVQDPAGTAVALSEQLGVRLALATAAAALAIGLSLALGYGPTVVLCVAITCLGLLINTAASTLIDVLHARERLRTMALLNLGSGLLLTAASLGAALCGAGPVGIATAYLAGPLCALLLLVRFLREQGVPIGIRFGREPCLRLLHGSRHFAAQQALAAGSTYAESLLLPRLAGAAEMGHFTAGSLMATRLSVMSDALGTAAYPMIVQRAQSGTARSRELPGRFALMAVAVGVALSILASLIASPLARLLIPASPELFMEVALISVWSLPLAGLESMLGLSMNAAGADGAVARASAPAAIVSIAVAVVLVTGFGAIGAAWSLLARPAIRCAFLLPLWLSVFRRSGSVRSEGEFAR
jgi:O-antigen/teichoic acid export membrane protein